MKHALLACALLLWLTPACSDPDVDGDDDETAGTLVVDWTIKGGTTEADCADAGALFVKVGIRSLHRRAAFDYTGSCNNLSTSMSLYPDDYEGDATLVGQSEALTAAVPVGPFSVWEGQVTSISVDFPSDAFR